jgi:hypothetical protein
LSPLFTPNKEEPQKQPAVIETRIPTAHQEVSFAKAPTVELDRHKGESFDEEHKSNHTARKISVDKPSIYLNNNNVKQKISTSRVRTCKV